MPFSHTISKHDKTALVNASGTIDLRSSILEIHSLASDKEFEPHYRVLVDLRQIRLSPTTADLFAIRDTLSAMRERFRGGVTLVVKEPELYLAKLACIIVNSAEFQMEAVTQLISPNLEGNRDNPA